VARLAAALGMPLSGVLGLRSAWRRPSRLVTNAAGLTLAVALIVVASGLRSIPHRTAVSPSGPGTAALLFVLGIINAVIVASFAARDSARNHAMLRAIGATPRQTVVSLVVSQLGACVLAIVVGIPLGLGVWRLIDNGDLPKVSVPVTDLALVAIATALIFTAAVSLPAWRLAQRSVTTALAYE
jgi:putative ABC transport system permease protein